MEFICRFPLKRRSKGLFPHKFLDDCHGNFFDFLAIFDKSIDKRKDALDSIHHGVYSPENHRKQGSNWEKDESEYHVEDVERVEHRGIL